MSSDQIGKRSKTLLKPCPAPRTRWQLAQVAVGMLGQAGGVLSSFQVLRVASIADQHCATFRMDVLAKRKLNASSALTCPFSDSDCGSDLEQRLSGP